MSKAGVAPVSSSPWRAALVVLILCSLLPFSCWALVASAWGGASGRTNSSSTLFASRKGYQTDHPDEGEPNSMSKRIAPVSPFTTKAAAVKKDDKPSTHGVRPPLVLNGGLLPGNAKMTEKVLLRVLTNQFLADLNNKGDSPCPANWQQNLCQNQPSTFYLWVRELREQETQKKLARAAKELFERIVLEREKNDAPIAHVLYQMINRPTPLLHLQPQTQPNNWNNLLLTSHQPKPTLSVVQTTAPSATTTTKTTTPTTTATSTTTKLSSRTLKTTTLSGVQRHHMVVNSSSSKRPSMNLDRTVIIRPLVVELEPAVRTHKRQPSSSAIVRRNENNPSLVADGCQSRLQSSHALLTLTLATLALALISSPN